MSDKKTSFKINFLKMQSQKYLRRGVLAKERLKSFQNREIIHTHGETKRNESTWGDLPVG